MAEINWTREAENWLRDIYNYIATDNPDAAARTLTEIYEKAQLLRTHPRLGQKYEPERSREIRILLHDHYLNHFYSPMIFTSTRFLRPPSNSP